MEKERLMKVVLLLVGVVVMIKLATWYANQYEK